MRWTPFRDYSGDRLLLWRYDPPGPIIQGIRVSYSGSTHPNNWDGFFDTGTNHTLVPITIFRDLRIAATDTGTIVREAEWSNPPTYSAFLPGAIVNLEIPTFGRISNVPVFGVSRGNILIGRNLLRAMRVRLSLDFNKLTFRLSWRLRAANIEFTP
jgi:hypothetical protein